MQQPPPPPTDRTHEGAALVGVVALGLMTALTVFTRTNFGRRALGGVPALGAIVVIVAYGAWAREPLMGPYLLAWLIAFVVQRVRTAVLWSRGWRIYSRYWGDPLGGRWFEAALCLGGGPALLQLGSPFGGFLLLGGLGIAVVTALDRRARGRQLEALCDAEIEQESLLDEYLDRG